jgi:acyl-CoA thioesterase I
MLRKLPPIAGVRSIVPAADVDMPDAPQPCDPHPDLVKFNYRLRHLTESLKRQRKIKVVAIGSSSTAGEDNTIPFPPRLELILRKRFPDRMIDVLDRGIGGQEAPEELSRFESDVIAEAPALVIWQVGTNAIYHRTLYDPYRVAGTIATGLSWLKGLEMDVILMDLQYAPVLLGDFETDLAAKEQKEKDTRLMVSLIYGVANAAKVNLFPRFALMERWVTVDRIDQARLIGPDGLHQTEFANDCVTQALDCAIGAAVGALPAAPKQEPAPGV